MTSDPRQPAQQDDPLEDEHLLEAIRASGYPFEVRILNQFRALGINANISHHLPTIPDGEVKEVDIKAQIHRYVEVPSGLVQIDIFPHVAAKKLPWPKQFIGVSAKGQYDDHLEVAGRSSSVSGVPTRGYVTNLPSDDLAHIWSTGGFADAFRIIGGRPHCVHWAIAGRKQPTGRGPWVPWAEGDRGFFDDFDVLRRATAYQGNLEGKAPLMGVPGLVAQPHLKFFTTALAVDSDSLAIYDPDTDKLSRSNWLTFRSHFGSGTYVDIVSRNGLDELIRAYNALADRLMCLLRILPKICRELRIFRKHGGTLLTTLRAIR